jgi:Fic-DOC domain mobile mystery protein B
MPERHSLFAQGSHAPGATAIDADEAVDLIPNAVTSLAQLNAFEQTNILAATEWALRPARRAGPDRVLTIDFLVSLHRRMFDQTWRWAGEFRRTDKNLGVHWPLIRVALRERLEDTRHWIAADVFTPDETAVRFHHAIVAVHPFPNGNGRWSRLAADTLLHGQRKQPFTWGASDLTYSGTARLNYLNALRSADRGDFSELLRFARS